jgi:Xaa-Pro aminopeptidase
MDLQKVYAERRRRLWSSFAEATADKQVDPTTLSELRRAGKAAIVIFAALEPSYTPFRQDNSFYYLTGIQEPGWVLVIDEQGISHLYVPQTTIDRSVWLVVSNPHDIDQLSGPYQWHELGAPYASYSLSWYAPEECYAQLVTDLHMARERGIQLFGANRAIEAYQNQREFIQKITGYARMSLMSDCSDLIGSMRRRKDAHELACIREAIAITAKAQHEARMMCSAVGIAEAYVKASLESVMVAHGSVPAFPSIVATGGNATVLHYTGSAGILNNNDLVVVDIGASYNQYAADITRTYAVSGTRTPRQEELYQRVLNVQQEIAARAKPGIWLRNSKNPAQSLHHIAVKLFAKQKLDHYFVHGIGHYLGLDVHDVGSYEEPLQPGDVITIEPGLYLRDEAIGIRIEDNYRITEQGVECLSEAIPK